MLHGKCEKCGRTSYLDQDYHCVNCMKRIDNSDLNNLLEKAKKTAQIGRSDTKSKLVGFLAGILKKEIFSGTILYWINFLLVQWSFTRITRNEDWTKFGLLKPVLPLTGWWNNYIYIIPKKAKKSNVVKTKGIAT